MDGSSLCPGSRKTAGALWFQALEPLNSRGGILVSIVDGSPGMGKFVWTHPSIPNKNNRPALVYFFQEVIGVNSFELANVGVDGLVDAIVKEIRLITYLQFIKIF